MRNQQSRVVDTNADNQSRFSVTVKEYTMSNNLRVVVALSIVAITIFLGAYPASANTYSGPVSITCTTFSAIGGPDTLDRNNTGTGQERVRLDVLDGNGIIIYTLTFQNNLGTYPSGLINTTAYTIPPTANPIIFKVTSFAGNGFEEQVTILGSGLCNGIPTAGVCPFSDGRLNHCDAGQTAAVYCQSDGSVTVLAIYKSQGYPAFTASVAEIAAVSAKPAKNTLIKQGNGAFLYRLTSGELQVNRRDDGSAAKAYSFRFKDCPKP
jgi:hypothetical protein